MEIKDHLLTDQSVSHSPSPNHGGPITPRFLIMHYTSGRNAQSSVAFLQSPKAKASAHLVIGRDGAIWQLVPFNRVAWHAGVSEWSGIEGLNNCSIGVELDNVGRLIRVGNQYQAWFGGIYSDNEVIQARHRNENADSYWHTYTEAQIAAALEIGELLHEHYGFEDILGHDDIAPGRKADPGPAFPMASYKAHVLGRQDDASPRYRVSAELLNLRSGPGPAFPIVREPIPLGAELVLQEMTSSWARVRVVDSAGSEGWVAVRYITKIG